MPFGRLGVLSALLLSAPLVSVVQAEPAGRNEAQIAQAQQPLTPEERARREREQKKGQEKAQPKGPPPAKGPPSPPPKAPLPLPKAPPPPPPKGPPPPPKPLPQVNAPAPQSPFEHKAPKAPQVNAPVPPGDHKAGTPPGQPPLKVAPLAPASPDPSKGAGVPPAGKEPAKRWPGPPDKGPAALEKAPASGQQAIAPPPGPARATLPQFQRPAPTAGPPPRIEELQKARQSRVEEGGRRTIIQEPGNRTIIKQDNRIVIRHDDGERFRRLGGQNAHTERRPDGMVETFYVRTDGVRVITVVDGSGRLVRRYRRGLDGRELNIIDNRRFWLTAGAVGAGAVGLAVLLSLPAPVVTLPPERYIVVYDRASEEDLYEALSAEPIERLERAYSLEEIRDNYALRQRLRRIDLDTINFEFGSWQVAEEQYPKLEHIASAMLRLLDRNPDEVFLIAAHTDAVGSDVDNLSLSDRRAEAVAEILSANFGVAPENLVTQGYGAQFLKIQTPGPEPRNRRVEIQRITPLMAER